MSAFTGLLHSGAVRVAGVRGPAASVRPDRPLYTGVVAQVERDGRVQVLVGEELVSATGLRGPLSVGDRVVFCGPGLVDPTPLRTRLGLRLPERAHRAAA